MIILQIIFWIFATLIAVLLALVLLVFLLSAVPIKYTVNASNNGEMVFSFRASYFFKFVRVLYEYRSGVLKTDFRILFFKIGEKKKKRRKQKSFSSSKEITANEPSVTDKSPSTDKSSSKKSSGKKPPEKKESLYERLIKVYAVLTDGQVKTIMKLVFATIKKICKVLRPKSIDISGVVGFSCPYTTGVFLGAYEAIAGMFLLRDKIRLAGDFNADETVIRINAQVRGKISIFRMMLPIIWLATRKPIFALIIKLWRKEELF